jgi:hypothetical protein
MGCQEQDEERKLKKTLFALLIIVALCVFTTSTALAGGDMVRGEKGKGEVNQAQVQDPPPFR